MFIDSVLRMCMRYPFQCVQQVLHRQVQHNGTRRSISPHFSGFFSQLQNSLTTTRGNAREGMLWETLGTGDDCGKTK